MRKSFNRKVKKIRQSLFLLFNRIFFIFKLNKQKIINEKEVKIIGMQRTGNHAIVNWIYSQCDELKCVLNHVAINRNPFIAFSKKGTVKEFDQNFKQKLNVTAERLGFFSSKKLLIHTYEDEMLHNVFNDNVEQNHDCWIGKSKERYDLLIIRDPFNLFASRLKREGVRRLSLRDKNEREVVINLWKNHAKEFIGETELLTHNKICVNYNSWFIDKAYREKLAEQLEIPFTDKSIDEVSSVGGGSSFDSTELHNNASEMKVLERWKAYSDDKDFIAIFQDAELIELYTKIFKGTPGEPVGGIAEFIKKINLDK